MKRVIAIILVILVATLFNNCDATGGGYTGKVYIKNSSGKDASNIELGPIHVDTLNAGEESTEYFYGSHNSVTINVPGFSPPSGMSGIIDLKSNSLYTLSLYKTSGGDYLFNMQGIIFDDSGTTETMR